MKITSQDVDGVEVVRISVKTLDADNAPEFSRELALFVERSDRILLDLEDVAFVDSSGLGAILDFLREMGEQETVLKLCRPARAVRSVMRMVGMHRLVPVFDTLDEAMASDEVFCTGTMGEIAPVVEIDGERIRDH